MKQLSVALPSLLDDWEEAITGCHSIGLRAPQPTETPNTGVVGGFGVIPVITLRSIASAVANCKQLSPIERMFSTYDGRCELTCMCSSMKIKKV